MHTFFFPLSDFRQGGRKGAAERKRERERNINLLFHLFMHSLVASHMCPDLGRNTQLWRTGTAP